MCLQSEAEKICVWLSLKISLQSWVGIRPGCAWTVRTIVWDLDRNVIFCIVIPDTGGRCGHLVTASPRVPCVIFLVTQAPSPLLAAQMPGSGPPQGESCVGCGHTWPVTPNQSRGQPALDQWQRSRLAQVRCRVLCMVSWCQPNPSQKLQIA